MKQGIQCSTGAAEAAQINVYYGIMEIKQGVGTRREMKLNIYPYYIYYNNAADNSDTYYLELHLLS